MSDIPTIPPELQAKVDALKETWPGQHHVSRYDWDEAIHRTLALCAVEIADLKEIAYAATQNAIAAHDKDISQAARIAGLEKALGKAKQWLLDGPPKDGMAALDAVLFPK